MDDSNYMLEITGGIGNNIRFFGKYCLLILIFYMQGSQTLG